MESLVSEVLLEVKRSLRQSGAAGSGQFNHNSHIKF